MYAITRAPRIMSSGFMYRAHDSPLSGGAVPKSGGGARPKSGGGKRPKSGGGARPKSGSKKPKLLTPANKRRRHRENYKEQHEHCLETPGVNPGECSKLDARQARFKGFMSKSKHDPYGYKTVDSIRPGGRTITRADLKRTKDGYGLNTKRPVSVELLAWQKALKAARNEVPGVVLPQKDPSAGNADRRRLYESTKTEYTRLLTDEVKDLQAKADAHNAGVKRHNDALRMRTASTSGRTTAKFVAWIDNVKYVRARDPDRFGKIQPKKDGTADQQEFYQQVERQYKHVRKSAGLMANYEAQAKSLDDKRAKKKARAKSLINERDYKNAPLAAIDRDGSVVTHDDIIAEAYPVRKSYKPKKQKFKYILGPPAPR